MLTKLSVPAIALALALALGTHATASAADDRCKLGQMAELPVTMRNGTPTVTAKVDGRTMTFIVQSGLFFSSVSAEAAEKLGLQPREVHDMPLQDMLGNGKSSVARTVTPKDFSLGEFQTHNMDFLVTAPGTLTGVDGQIGQNILGAADVEYDLPDGVIRLFRPLGCGGKPLAYWGGQYSTLPIERIEPRQPIVGQVDVNGRKVRAMFDTGWWLSAISRTAATKAGTPVEAMDVRRLGTFGRTGNILEAWQATFDTVGLGDEKVQKARLMILDFSRWTDFDALIGTDFFLAHRVYVARSQNRMYFSYVGGPVFRLDQTAVAANPVEPAVKPEALPMSAEGFNRRGAALVARREYAAAIEAYSHAIEADPTNAQYLYGRAQARYAANQPEAGRKDLDAALKLAPANTDALLLRARAALVAHDDAAAAADLDAFIAASPGSKDAELVVGELYEGYFHADEAVAHYSKWIAAHPGKPELFTALGDRCWSRTVLGKELELARADCDAALRIDRASPVLSSRGTISLKQNRYDEAITDFDASLKLQPKSAWSHYARGLAKLRKGDPGGREDIDAAKTLNPQIEDYAKKIGLIP